MILGSGWAGYALARLLSPHKYERVIVSPRSYFVFTPLLASTAVGTLEFRAAAEPVRRIKGLDAFHQGWADEVDFARRVVRVERNVAMDRAETVVVPPSTPGADGDEVGKRKGAVFEVPYDRLVIAVGAYSQTFGVPGVRPHAHLLRDVSDARRIRLRVLRRFEQAASVLTNGANTAAADAQRRALLHFAVVGGGPTGVEFAAELHDLIHEDLLRLYPWLSPYVKITVYDVAEKILPMFDRELSAYAMATFAREGIMVKTGHHLLGIREVVEDNGMGGAGDLRTLRLNIKEEPDEVPAGIVVWSTGLMRNPLVERLVGTEFAVPVEMGGTGRELVRLQTDPKTGGILTDDRLRVKVSSSSPSPTMDNATSVLPNVYAIGDCAVVDTPGKPALPATAQVASQKAAYLAKQLNGTKTTDKPFRFRNWGMMAYLGGWRAIHQSEADELKGRAAWLLWRTAYLTYSVSLRNKIMVPFYWFMTWVFGRDITRF